MSDRGKQLRSAGLRLAGVASLFLMHFYYSACFPYRASFSPPPPRIESIEGYASLQLKREGATAKSRFSFLFLLPDQGRIEIPRPLGGTAAVLFLENEEAFFVLPAKRVYWRSTQEEAMTKFIGFALSLEEITEMLSGRLTEWRDWDLEKDDQGRVVRGKRDGLKFEVKQFLEGSSLPGQVVFSREGTRGSLKILGVSFNKPLKEDAFCLFFLEDKAYRPVSWDEIEKWIRNED